MLKKSLGIILSVILIVSMVGCSQSDTESPTSEGQDSNNSSSATDDNDMQEETVTDDTKSEERWVPESGFTIRVPFAAGGTLDSVTRIVGQGLQDTYGETVVVNNITGASGALAVNDLLMSDAAGTEMMSGAIMTFTLAPLFNQDIVANLEDFQIVSGLISEDFVLCSSPKNSGIETWEDVIEKANGDGLIFASNPPGGTTHMLAMALFGSEGIEAGAITDNGGNKNVLALVSGDADVAIVTTSNIQQYVEDGTVNPIMVFSSEPYTGFDGIEIPTASSFGYDINFKSMNFIMVKAGVDQKVIDQLYSDILAFYETDEFKEMAEKINFVPDTSNGDEVMATVQAAEAFCQTVYDTYYK